MLSRGQQEVMEREAMEKYYLHVLNVREGKNKEIGKKNTNDCPSNSGNQVPVRIINYDQEKT